MVQVLSWLNRTTKLRFNKIGAVNNPLLMPILYSEIGFETAETDFCFGRNPGRNGLFTLTNNS